jgi:hypothetical protein
LRNQIYTFLLFAIDKIYYLNRNSFATKNPSPDSSKYPFIVFRGCSVLGRKFYKTIKDTANSGIELLKILKKSKITFGNTEIAKKNLEAVFNENKSLILASNNLIKIVWL